MVSLNHKHKQRFSTCSTTPTTVKAPLGPFLILIYLFLFEFSSPVIYTSWVPLEPYSLTPGPSAYYSWPVYFLFWSLLTLPVALYCSFFRSEIRQILGKTAIASLQTAEAFYLWTFLFHNFSQDEGLLSDISSVSLKESEIDVRETVNLLSAACLGHSISLVPGDL